VAVAESLRIVLSTTNFSNPAGPCARANHTSPMPPDASFPSTRYRANDGSCAGAPSILRRVSGRQAPTTVIPARAWRREAGDSAHSCRRPRGALRDQSGGQIPLPPIARAGRSDHSLMGVTELAEICEPPRTRFRDRLVAPDLDAHFVVALELRL